MDIQNILSELKAEFSRINHAIAALEGLFSSEPRRGRPPKSKTAALAPTKKRRTMSAAARKRISKAMKQPDSDRCAVAVSRNSESFAKPPNPGLFGGRNLDDSETLNFSTRPAEIPSSRYLPKNGTRAFALTPYRT